MRELLARLRAPRIAIALLALALLIAACGDDATTEATAGSDEAMSDEAVEDGDHHDHGDTIEVPDGMDVPGISITTAADSVSGTNLFVELEDFAISPEHASTDPVDGEGHLHLYVDGERVLRFYNTALQIAGLEPGDHEISVEVSANNHSAYAVDGEPIRATETVTVDESEHHHADHEQIEVAAAAAPTVDLSVAVDPKSGWNLQAELTGFDITPENVGGDHVDGEGHLHLYVDGERITRLYGPWWHLAELTAGSHEVTLELSGNDHSVYAVDGEAIVASANIEVSADQATAEADPTMDHDGMDDDEHDGSAMADDDGSAMADEDGAATIVASVSGGIVETASDRVEVELGSTLAIQVDSDTADEVHVHGYDLFADVGPGSPAEISFVADIPGVFEIELEGARLLLVEIAVG